MAILYDKKSGKEYKVPHAVDVKDWMATGKYTDKDPKANKETIDKKDYSKD